MEEQVMDSAEFIEKKKNGDEIFITDPTWEDDFEWLEFGEDMGSGFDFGESKFQQANRVRDLFRCRNYSCGGTTEDREEYCYYCRKTTGVNIQKQKGVTYNAIHTVP
jgi:hypothetical protein